MENERWRRIEKLYHAALDRDPAKRAEFLDGACLGDEEVRAEVESLLKQGSGFFGQSPWDAHRASGAHPAGGESTVTQLGSGQLLGRYRIEAKLGSGGMGEVFSAVDTRLGRKVAIKKSLERFSERFEREARAISALNHPHICTLYDVGADYLVMELVEGETLAGRLKKGPISIQETARLGAQIAGALAAAHAEEIVHRDLKPANIMLARTGVKVLDFGIAKSARDETLTAAGVLVGTPVYMAPEQAAGTECDARSDIYSLGLILYEMAAGKRFVPGQTLPPKTFPERFGHALEMALAQDPVDRWQSAADLRRELEWAAQAADSAGSLPEGRATGPAVRWAAGTALALAAILGAWMWGRGRGSEPAEELRLSILPPPGYEFQIGRGSALSPDGRTVAFVAGDANGSRLWVRRLADSEAREIRGTEDAAAPFWSPDGRSLGFFARGKLMRIDLAHGSPQAICDVQGGRGGTWGPDGVILFNAFNDGPILRVSANGGTPVALTSVDASRSENSHRWPQWLPGGRQFLFFVRANDPAVRGVYLASVERPREKRLIVRSLASGYYAPGPKGGTGRLLWVRDDKLMAQTLDVEKATLTGEAFEVAQNAASAAVGASVSYVSPSNTGSLLYGGLGDRLVEIGLYDRTGRKIRVVGKQEQYIGLRLSPDGKRIAVGLKGDLWQVEIERNLATMVASGGMPEGSRAGGCASCGVGGPFVWSPDSSELAYNRGAPPNIYVRDANAAKAERRVTDSRDSQNVWDWSRDGKLLLFSGVANDLSAKTLEDLWICPASGACRAEPYLQTEFRERAARFSPDGRWIAYASDESGRTQIYVQAHPRTGQKWQVSNGIGDLPRWRGDGKELFYLEGNGRVMSVQVGAGSGGLTFTAPALLCALPTRAGNLYAESYDVTADGQRLIALTPVAGAQPGTLTLVLNWRGNPGAEHPGAGALKY